MTTFFTLDSFHDSPIVISFCVVLVVNLDLQYWDYHGGNNTIGEH